MQILVIALCFLVVATDGFDTADIGYIAPTLKVQWSLKPQQLAPALPQVFGLMTTAFSGPLADRFERKTVLVFTTAAFDIVTIASASSCKRMHLRTIRAPFAGVCANYSKPLNVAKELTGSLCVAICTP